MLVSQDVLAWLLPGEAPINDSVEETAADTAKEVEEVVPKLDELSATVSSDGLVSEKVVSSLVAVLVPSSATCQSSSVSRRRLLVLLPKPLEPVEVSSEAATLSLEVTVDAVLA
jgi:hypothetical protein